MKMVLVRWERSHGQHQRSQPYYIVSHIIHSIQSGLDHAVEDLHKTSH